MVAALASFSAALAGPCGADGGSAATVREVGDDLSLLLDDGRRLRLPGVEPVRDTPGRPGAAAAARDTLAAWLGGHAVSVLAQGPADRWERVPALVSAPATPGDGPLLAAAVQLVDAGLARARPDGVPADCAVALLRAEAAARDGVLGLWADPYYAIRTASDGQALLSLAGEWVVVEGRVAHVGRTRTATYLDLDSRRGGLALRLARSVSVTSRPGDPGQDGWLGRHLRARGVMDDRNGPQIDIRDAAQIEWLPPAGTPGEAADVGR